MLRSKEKQGEYFYFDTHVHTRETSCCGKIRGLEVARAYQKAGYHGVVITDHYCRDYFRRFHRISWEEKIERFLSGYRAAKEEGVRVGLIVLLGIELRFDGSNNDYLVYGIDEEFLKKYPELYSLGLKEFRGLVKRLETEGKGKVLIYQAHPFRLGLSPADPLLLDGVEVFNGNPRQQSRNELAYKYAKERGLKMISGSDFHRSDDLGRGGIMIPKNAETMEEFIQLLEEEKIIRLICSRAQFSFLKLATGFVNLLRKMAYPAKK